MKRDPDKLKVGTLRSDDPRLTIGTVTLDKIIKGELEWDCDLVAPLLKGEGREGSS